MSRDAVTARLEQALAREELVAHLTRLTPPEVGARMLLFPDGTTVGSIGGGSGEAAGITRAAEMMAAARGRLAQSVEIEEATSPARLFIEVFPPPPHLVIFGGVHVALPLVRFAKELGFRVTLADPRETFANPERFPEVDRIIPEWPGAALEQLEIGPSTYVVILTHDPKLDEPALEGVVDRGAAYVGAIGSRRTHQERFERMAHHGVTREQLAEVYAPIGLDLAAESPEEIALAIMAEIVAVRRGGRGGFLRDR